MSKCKHEPFDNGATTSIEKRRCRHCGQVLYWSRDHYASFDENERRQRRRDSRDILWALVIALLLALVTVLRKAA